jgi:hypothetical protein
MSDANRLKSLLGRLYGTHGWDPSDYGQWTRYLILRPLAQTIPLVLGLATGLVIGLAMSDGLWLGVVLAGVGAVVGEIAGAWYWLRSERRQQSRRDHL